MSDLKEIAVISDSSGEQCNCYIYDIFTKTILMTYKNGGVIPPKSLFLLGNDYLLSGDKLKPLFHVWNLNSQEPVQGMRFVSPGRISALVVSPNMSCCVGGIEEKLYVWQVTSGNLLSIASRHLGKVNVIKFTDDGTHFASGGEDSMVLVWSVEKLVSQQFSNRVDFTMSDNTEPVFSFSDHTLPVNDLAVGRSGMRARLFSVSLDQKMNIYSLSSGSLLLTVVCGYPLVSIAVDSFETRAYLGTSKGKILQINYFEKTYNTPHFLSEAEKSNVFSGHDKAVTCLSLSMDGLSLLSGSDDNKAMLWNIPSKQCCKVVEMKGPITNAFFYKASENIFADNFKPKIVLHSFQRTINSDVDIKIKVRNTEKLEDNLLQNQFSSVKAPVHSDTSSQEEISRLKNINEQLYKFAVEKILVPHSKPSDNTDANSKDTNGINTSKIALLQRNLPNILKKKSKKHNKKKGKNKKK